MKVVSDGLRKRLPTLSELWLYGKKASTGGNGLASPLPSHADAYNHMKLQPCAAPDVGWPYPFIGVICLTSTVLLAW